MASSVSTSRTRLSLVDDILIEIFTRLPLDSICKFKCLSKVWLANLSDPSFITKWFQINKKSLPWIQYNSLNVSDADGSHGSRSIFKMSYPELHSEFMSKKEYFISFEFLKHEKLFKGASLVLLGSSNGLVLCWSFSSEDFQWTYHVCNPLNQRWVSLPSPPRFLASEFDINCISCENSSSFAGCYKVVHIPRFKSPSKKFNVDIFSSDSGVWESNEVSCDQTIEWEWSNHNSVVFLDGVLYWIINRQNRLLVYHLNQNNGSHAHRCSLITLPDEEFDVLETGDEYGVLETGDEYGVLETRDGVLGESEGWVCYARIRRAGGEMTVSVWVLDEVNWQVLHKDISIDDILAELYSQTHFYGDTTIQVLGFSPIDRNVLLLGYKVWFNWAFNIQTRSVEELPVDKRDGYTECEIYRPFVLKPLPTLLPPPSWIDT